MLIEDRTPLAVISDFVPDNHHSHSILPRLPANSTGIAGQKLFASQIACSGAETDHQDNGGRKKQGGNANRNANDEALQLHVREHGITRVNEEQTKQSVVDVLEASVGVALGRALTQGWFGRASRFSS